MALAGTDTSSLLEILEGSFGHVDLDTTTSSIPTEITEVPVTRPNTTEKLLETPPEETPEKTSILPIEESSSASTELVFPLKSIHLVIARLPEPFLPLCGPETLSHYRCQYPSCANEFSQKAAVHNHVCCDHLNIALACLYCSLMTTPKCTGTVLLPGSTIPADILKITFLSTPMILPFPSNLFMFLEMRPLLLPPNHPLNFPTLR